MRNEEIFMDFISKGSVKIQARSSKLPQLLPLLSLPCLLRAFLPSASSSLRYLSFHLLLQFPYTVYMLEKNLELLVEGGF